MPPASLNTSKPLSWSYFPSPSLCVWESCKIPKHRGQSGRTGAGTAIVRMRNLQELKVTSQVIQTKSFASHCDLAKGRVEEDRVLNSVPIKRGFCGCDF